MAKKVSLEEGARPENRSSAEGLGTDTLGRIKAVRQNIANSMKPLTDAAKQSSRLSEADYNIRINTQR